MKGGGFGGDTSRRHRDAASCFWGTGYGDAYEFEGMRMSSYSPRLLSTSYLYVWQWRGTGTFTFL